MRSLVDDHWQSVSKQLSLTYSQTPTSYLDRCRRQSHPFTNKEICLQEASKAASVRFQPVARSVFSKLERLLYVYQQRSFNNIAHPIRQDKTHFNQNSRYNFLVNNDKLFLNILSHLLKSNKTVDISY